MARLSESEAALIGRALGEPNRLALYTQIAGCEEVFCGMMEAVHKITGATLSHHLKVLTDLGLVVSRRSGTYIYYRAVPERLAAYVEYLSAIASQRGKVSLQVENDP
jgi:ArsR family transcriptional regulator, arsenate/arsenite/antimonite-responsive transcriptional repressor